MCRDPTSAPLQLPYRDTKGDVATPPRLHLPRHENHVPTKDQPGPSPNHVMTQKLMSRPGAKENLSRVQRPCRGRALVLSHALLHAQPLGRACMRAYHAHATLPLSRHHLLCHDPGLEMGSSPSIWSPAPVLLVLPTIKPIKIALLL